MKRSGFTLIELLVVIAITGDYRLDFVSGLSKGARERPPRFLPIQFDANRPRYHPVYRRQR